LEIDDRRTGRSDKRRLETSGCNRHLRTNADRSELAVRRAHARILNKLRRRTRGEKLRNGRRNVEREAAAVEALEATQGHGGAGRRGWSGGCRAGGRRCCRRPSACISELCTLWRQNSKLAQRIPIHFQH